MPDDFADPKRVTKSRIPAMNAPIKFDVMEGQTLVANESNLRLKRSRQVSSKDKRSSKRKRSYIL